MPNKSNKKKELFLQSLLQEDLTPKISDAKDLLSFNFRYFDNSQKAGQDFKDWSDKERLELLEKLKQYSSNSKTYWMNQRVGNGGLKVLEIYGNFPVNTKFKYPSFVPQNVDWARFRLESSVRLVGFFISKEDAQNYGLSENVFYVVFLDHDHNFYLTENK